MTAHILLVGDEPVLRAPLAAAGHRVSVAADPDAALAHMRRLAPDVVLIDLALPGLDGQALVRDIRLESDVPVLVMARADREAESIAALDQGADDYVGRPFAPGELLSRIHLAARRRDRQGGDIPCFATGALAIDFARRRVSLDGRVVRLSPKEYALLCALARRAGEVVGHRQLLAAGWGPTAADTQYLRVYIGLLRQKIEEDPSEPRFILTEPGIGYRLAIG